MEEMEKHLPETDVNRLKALLAIKESYENGTLSLAEARLRLKQEVGTLKPYEIALAEQRLSPPDDDECRKENIQQMLELYEEVMDTSRPELEENHPIACYYRENDELRRILLSIEDLVQYPVIKNQWLELYDRLGAYRLHLSRKQNQLYSVLEKKGFDRPTTTMWLLDDFVWEEIKEARALLEADQDDVFVARQATVVADVRDLMQKEETVLYPTSLVMISPAEFEEMKSGDREIGFAWIETRPHASQVAEPTVTASPDGFAAELAALLGKYGYSTGGNAGGGVLDVATGKLTLEQINLIYKHLPVDISYVDEKELVCFYSDTDHRVFPRSKNVIGRNVKNCHPRTSVHIVEEIIEKFRSGEQDHVEFWINKPGCFIYIYYVAVRDAEGRFRGVLEMMQDCTHIRSLEGSRTLLTWDGEQQGGTSAPDAVDETIAPATEANEWTSTSVEVPQEITADTLLKDLLAAFPTLKDRLTEISPKFQLLKTPLARVILPKATLGQMSERGGIPLQPLLEAVRRLVAEEKTKG